MRRGLVLAALPMALTFAAHAQPPSQPPPLPNMDFEDGVVGQPPPGWSGAGVVTSAEAPQGGARSLRLSNDAQPWLAFSRAVDAGPYRGRTVRLRAAVRTGAAGGAGLWLRIDGAAGGPPLFLDTMSDRPVRAADWTWAEVVADVPPGARSLVIGGLVNGHGVADFDTASLEIVPATYAPMAPAARIYLHRALRLMQDRFIDRGRVDWPALRARAEAAAAHARTPAGTYGAIRVAIAGLGERHTFLMPPSPTAASPSPASPLATSASPGPAPFRQPEITAPSPHVALVTIPGFLGAPVQAAAFTRILRDGIGARQAAGTCGWIVDLRGNGGGDMWPMLSGLVPLLGPPPWGQFQGAGGEGRLVWTKIGDGAGAAAARRAAPLASPESPSERLAPVAVLIGPDTASSGEMVALAFAGRAGARSFGAPTAGLTTGNTPERLSDGAILALTETRVLDRRGHRLDGPLRPDQPTAPADAQAAALAWLADQGCR